MGRTDPWRAKSMVHLSACFWKVCQSYGKVSSLSTLSMPLYKGFWLQKSIRHTLYLKIIHVINNFSISYGKMTNKICCSLRAYGWKNYSWPEAIHASKIFWKKNTHCFYHKNPSSIPWNVSNLEKFSFKSKMGSKCDCGQIE